jgi:hypothetical protein
MTNGEKAQVKLLSFANAYYFSVLTKLFTAVVGVRADGRKRGNHQQHRGLLPINITPAKSHSMLHPKKK